MAGKLELLSKQKPNSKAFFFFRLNMWKYIYYVKRHKGGYDRKTDKLQHNLDSLRGKYRRASSTDTTKLSALGKKINVAQEKLAARRTKVQNYKDNVLEAPVVFDSVQAKISVVQMHKFLMDKGYYNNSVTYSTKLKRHFKLKLYYNVNTGPLYHINRIDYFIDDDRIANIVKNDSVNSVLIPGKAYDGDVLTEERERIINLLRNNGYYNFSREHIYYQVDTGLSGNYVNVAFNITNPDNKPKHTIYRIHNIYITPEYVLGDKTHKDTTSYNGNYFISNGMKLRPEILSSFIFLRKGALYKNDDYQNTLTRLSYLRMYQFIEINFRADSSGNSDTALMECYIKLTPLDRQEIGYSLEFNLIDENQPYLDNSETRSFGNYIYGSYLTRNIGKSGMQLEVKPRAGLEIPITLFKNTRIFDTINYQLGITNSLIVPRLLMPKKGLFRLWDTLYTLTHELPGQTSFNLNYLFESNKFYNRSTFNTNITYQVQWKAKYKLWGIESYRLFIIPIDISLINSTYHSDAFKSRVIGTGDPLLINLFDSHLITDFRAVMLLNQQPLFMVKKRTTFTRIGFEVGGGVPALIESIVKSGTSAVQTDKLGNLAYFQYVRGDIDYRRYYPVLKTSNLAFRAMLGFGRPFGISKILPFEKRFAIGGSNSVRAFPLRTLGPGVFTNTIRDFDRSGDIKIEMNAEFRFPIYKIVKGAFFVDAGNVWTFNDDTTRKGAQFIKTDFTFVKQFAIGTGFGLRFDFSLLVFRLDFAIPIHDPGQEAGYRYVIKNYKESKWLGNNLNINLGLGYPF